jgi:hypothetical protein
MTDSEVRISRFGGLTSILAGVLFFVANLIMLSLPTLPSAETDFLKWISENRTSLAIHNETLFFAAISLIPSLFVLYKLLRNHNTISSVMGLGLMALVIPVLAVLDIVEGRLVYPVYDIGLSLDALKLVLSVYYGGMHAVSLILGASILFISFVLRDTIFPKYHWYLGLITGVFQFLGAYPWRIGFVFNLIAIFTFSLWLVLNGSIILLKFRNPAQQ